MKLHAHSLQYARKLASTKRALETLLTINDRSGALLGTLLIPIDFFSSPFFSGWPLSFH